MLLISTFLSNHFLVLLLLTRTKSKEFDPSPEPNLAQLLTHVDHCDLQIVHNGGHSSSFAHLGFVPTTIFDTQTFLRINKLFDIAKVKVLPCRVIYAIFHTSRENQSINAYQRTVYQYLGYASSFKSTRYTTSGIMIPLLFSSDATLIKSTVAANEYLDITGIVTVTSDGNLLVCFVTYTLTESTCGLVAASNNLLQIHHQARKAVGRTWGYLGDTDVPDGTDILQIPGHSNPFNLLKNISIDIHILQSLFSNSNSSLLVVAGYGSWVHLLTRFVVDLNHELSRAGNNVWVQTGNTGYSFLTCYGKRVLTFDFYWNPFQPELWAALGATYISLSLLLASWLFWNRVKNSFCPWLYVLGALLEDGVPLPRTLKDNPGLRAIFGCWIITCVFLTNCYNGLMITGLNSPLAAATVTKFRDLVCDWQQERTTHQQYANLTQNTDRGSVTNFNFHWYARHVVAVYEPDNTDKTENPYASSTKNCFSILSSPYEPLHVPKLILYLYEIYSKYAHNRWDMQDAELELNVFYPKQRHLPRNIGTLIKQGLGYS